MFWPLVKLSPHHDHPKRSDKAPTLPLTDNLKEGERGRGRVRVRVRVRVDSSYNSTPNPNDPHLKERSDCCPHALPNDSWQNVKNHTWLRLGFQLRVGLGIGLGLGLGLGFELEVGLEVGLDLGVGLGLEVGLT
jgi:hypothetical protein